MRYNHALKNFCQIASYRVLAVLAISTALFFSPRHASAVVIDPFEGPMQLLTTDPGSLLAESSLSDGSILGGERDVVLNQTTPNGGTSRILINEIGISGYLDLSMDTGISGSATISWDGVDGDAALNPVGLGGIDLTESGAHNALVIDVPFDDLPLDLTLTVFSNAENASAITLQIPGNILFAPAQQFIIPYVDFVTTAGTGADFSSVGAIEMFIDHFTPATDLQIASIHTVPEPGSVVLFAIGILGLGILRKFRKP